MIMKTNIQINVVSFDVPANLIGSIVEDRPVSIEPAAVPPAAPPIFISFAAVDAETLERLCDEFRTEVFRRAGKRRPVREEKEPETRRLIGELRTALGFMLNNIGQPDCQETHPGFEHARKAWAKAGY